MRTFRALTAVALVSACAALAGCGLYGPRGDRGLPPAPQGVAYPNLNQDPRDPNRRLRSADDQSRLKADLLARKSARR